MKHTFIQFEDGERDSNSDGAVVEAVEEWLDRTGLPDTEHGRPMRHYLSHYYEGDGDQWPEWQAELNMWLAPHGYTIQDDGDVVTVEEHKLRTSATTKQNKGIVIVVNTQSFDVRLVLTESEDKMFLLEGVAQTPETAVMFTHCTTLSQAIALGETLGQVEFETYFFED